MLSFENTLLNEQLHAFMTFHQLKNRSERLNEKNETTLFHQIVVIEFYAYLLLLSFKNV